MNEAPIFARTLSFETENVYARIEPPTLQILRACEKCTRWAAKMTKASIENERVVLGGHVLCHHKECGYKQELTRRSISIGQILEKINSLEIQPARIAKQ